MTRSSKVWPVVAGLFILVNLGGGVFAAVQGEAMHAAGHAVLALLGVYFTWRLSARRGQASYAAQSPELSDRLTSLEQSLDAIAIEVERIGEGQRFMTRLFTEKSTRDGRGAGAS